MRHRRTHSTGAVTIRRITGRTIGRFMVMDRISGTVIGAIVAGEAIGTAEATEDGMGGTKKSGKITPRGNEMNPG